MRIIWFGLFILIIFSLSYADCAFVAHDCRTHCCGKQGGAYMQDSINDMQEALSLEKQGRVIIFNKGTQPGGEDICIAYAYSSNLNANTMADCINDCQANAGCGTYTTTSSTTTQTSELVCDNEMGEIIKVTGSTSYYTRAGIKNVVTVGQKYCEGDIIETGEQSKTYVVIKFKDGNIRYVTKRSTYVLIAYKSQTYYEGIMGAVQMFTNEGAQQNYDTICGGITAPRAGFKVHSNVLFEIDNTNTQVTVLEGNVDVIDMNSGQIVNSVETGEQYQVSTGQDPKNGVFYNIDLSDYSEEISRVEDVDNTCCLAFVPMFIIFAFLFVKSR